jgi:hypothetical protein
MQDVRKERREENAKDWKEGKPVNPSENNGRNRINETDVTKKV